MPDCDGEAPFRLGRPTLVCRWRLAGGRLPLAGRHLRALRGRLVGGRPLPPALVAWVGQRLEWALPAAAADHPDGVLLLTVDDAGRAALAVGPYQRLRATDLDALVGRAQAACQEARATGVAPETLWLVRGGRLVCLDDPAHAPSGSATLVRDVAQAYGIEVARRGLGEADARGGLACDEAFLASDEHGVVVAHGHDAAVAQRLAGAFEALRERCAEG